MDKPNNNTNILLVKQFLDYVSDFTKETIHQFEMEPIQVNNTTFVTGFRIVNGDVIEAHIKRGKTIVIDTSATRPANDSSLYMMIPSEDIYLNISILDQAIINLVIVQFKERFFKLNRFHVALLTHNDKLLQGVMFEENKTMCKYVLEYRRKHPDTKHKLLHFGENELYERLCPVTEMDVVTSPIDE